MQELIKINYNESGQAAVSARDLHKFLDVATPFKDWFPRMKEHGFILGEDYTPHFFEHPQNKQQTADYAMSIDMAKEVSMLQRNDKGRLARKYFIACEKELIAGKKEAATLTPLEYAKALVAAEEKALLNEQRAIEAEKTVSLLTHVSKTFTCTEIAKEMGMKSANELNQQLHEMGIQYKHNGTWLLYSKYADLGYVHIKQEVLDNGTIIYHRKITGAGREWLLKLFSRA